MHRLALTNLLFSPPAWLAKYKNRGTSIIKRLSWPGKKSGTKIIMKKKYYLCLRRRTKELTKQDGYDYDPAFVT